MQIERTEAFRYATEFAHVVAEEVHARYPQRADFGDRGGEHLAWEKVAEKKVDRLACVFLAQKIHRGAPRAFAPRSGLCIVERQEAFRPITPRRFNAAIARLGQPAAKIVRPKCIGGDGVRTVRLLAAEKYTQRAAHV